MKQLLYIICLLFACVLFAQAADKKDKENPEGHKASDDFYLDDSGRDKASSAFDKYFTNSKDSRDLFEWVGSAPEIPRDTSTEQQLKQHPHVEAHPGVEGLKASAAHEPSTSGEGLKMQSNRKNWFLDLWKGDPNDPKVLFKKPLGFKDVAKECLDKHNWYYRTYDGSCNWVDSDNWKVGKSWEPFQRDTPNGPEYEKFVHSPRKFVPYSRPFDKPNPRELSLNFFTNVSGIAINHTPVLTGLIEFIIHDVSWSDTSAETLKVPIPCKDHFNPDCKDEFFSFNVTNKKKVDGLDRSINSATTWVDGSQIYGVSAKDSKRLRSGIQGKLKVQNINGNDYIAFNPHGPPGWFDGGDVRVNQDWYITAIQTLWVREHNRLADILVSLHADWNDEQIFLTAREVVTCKMFLIALAYMKGYFITPEMKKLQPIDDNLQLVRLAYGSSYFQVNPLMKFAQLGLDPTGKHPAVASDEMSVGYRFHDLIPIEVPLIDSNNVTFETIDFLDTIYTPGEFIKHGIDSILRGAALTTLPGFHSGVQQNLRNAKFNLGDPKTKKPFDIAMWSILRERTRGVATFNEYFRFWNNNDPKHLQVKIREKFTDFTSNAKLAEQLAKFYKTPDDVDLVVGLQMDEELFPGMQIPKSFVIVSLLSLYSLGISDRHGPLFNLVACLQFPNTLQDCRTTNVLQDLLWKPNKDLVDFGSPNSKLLDTFWFNEIDYQHQGVLALWRLVTENSNVKCVPVNPLFIPNTNKKSPDNTPYNPVVCTQDHWKQAWKDV